MKNFRDMNTTTLSAAEIRKILKDRLDAEAPTFIGDHNTIRALLIPIHITKWYPHARWRNLIARARKQTKDALSEIAARND